MRVFSGDPRPQLVLGFEGLARAVLSTLAARWMVGEDRLRCGRRLSRWNEEGTRNRTEINYFLRSGEGRMAQFNSSSEVEVVPPGLDDSPAERDRAHLANLRGRTSSGSQPNQSMSPSPSSLRNGHGSGGRRGPSWISSSGFSSMSMATLRADVAMRRGSLRLHCARRLRRQFVPLADQWIPSHGSHLDGGRVVPSKRTSRRRPGVP